MPLVRNLIMTQWKQGHRGHIRNSVKRLSGFSFSCTTSQLCPPVGERGTAHTQQGKAILIS